MTDEFEEICTYEEQRTNGEEPLGVAACPPCGSLSMHVITADLLLAIGSTATGITLNLRLISSTCAELMQRSFVSMSSSEFDDGVVVPLFDAPFSRRDLFDEAAALSFHFDFRLFSKRLPLSPKLVDRPLSIRFRDLPLK